MKEAASNFCPADAAGFAVVGTMVGVIEPLVEAAVVGRGWVVVLPAVEGGTVLALVVGPAEVVSLTVTAVLLAVVLAVVGSTVVSATHTTHITREKERNRNRKTKQN